jgi:hypothetical protein
MRFAGSGQTINRQLSSCNQIALETPGRVKRRYRDFFTKYGWLSSFRIAENNRPIV